ncbi:carboxylesterase/lipase family protein [Tsukamurella tyrosinosolvens]|uniref:carboxylesterase/lipase family protein n=1 Tax=Tsukamurella tyrosinosolvens TaxID=57704 RepID=UPI0021629796|nr:carboxylesterase family protein [Tsukamurella tyrosinosolvens]
MHSWSVRTKSGAVRGRCERGVCSYRGIPYAAAPFGANRMRPPVPRATWDGELEATEYGPTAPKGNYPPHFVPLFPEVVIPGDDCLNLNVWAPDSDEGGLPVLVWFHGGSFMNGSSSVGEYDGSSFARDGVVCVTANYRLGADGFLHLGDGADNLGLLDQVAALHWVQDNIAAFGGDPASVTVAGESAGAMSVTTLLSMPATEGLFARAIAQSGAAAHTLTVDQARMVAGRLAERLGVAPEREAIAALPIDELVQAASDLVTEVQSGADPAVWGAIALSLLPFGPVCDGAVLGDMPMDAIVAGHGADVPLLIGSNRDEARLFFVPTGALATIEDTILAATVEAYGLTRDGLALYRSNRPRGNPGDVLAAVITDWYYRIPAIRVAEARLGSPGAQTWMYRFDHPEPRGDHLLGACHGAEIPYVFDTIDRPELRPRLGDAPSHAVAERTHQAWVDFVTRGSPGWAPYDAVHRTTGLLSNAIDAVDDPAGDERAVWEGIR